MGLNPPLAIDIFCGLGGWTEGLLAEGYRVVGFDLERHVYGEASYPAQLVLQDVLTLHGSQFKDAALIVASPPCQEFSYMAMPWTKAKEKAKALRDGRDDPKRLTALFDACFRIQREAIEAAGHHIPLVVENVCGAQKWVGRARWHYGSFYLWGDVPALMPIVFKAGVMKRGVSHREGSGETNFHQTTEQRAEARGVKVATMGAGWYPPGHLKHVPGLAFNTHAERATKNDGGSWFGIQDQREQKPRADPRDTIANAAEGCKQAGSGAAWFDGEVSSKSSKSTARKAASAHIAKIPYELARHIARSWKPLEATA